MARLGHIDLKSFLILEHDLVNSKKSLEEKVKGALVTWIISVMLFTEGFTVRTAVLT